MKTATVLIALSVGTLLCTGPEALAWQQPCVIGNGFAFAGRPIFIVPPSRTIIVERPFFDRRFFDHRQVIIERRVFVPRRNFFFFEGSRPFN
jgi:hypothetical protein